MVRLPSGRLSRMADRPDKPKVVDEVWDDDRIASFLHADPTDPCVDFYVLLKAYQGMRAHDFERFISFYVEAGRDLDARDERGQTLVEVITPHRHAGPFIERLLAAGAAPPRASGNGGSDQPRAYAPEVVVQEKS
jgi:hypothetical protein